MIETIAAVATPPGNGALAIVRLSGPRAIDVLRAVFREDGASAWDERAVRHGRVVAPDGATLDDGLAWFARAPRTYTGEDTAELTAHGGAFVTARVLAAFLAKGARLAEPGEFTRRAFLNGRLDLAEAEAVADVIAASTDDALRIARTHLAGGLSEKIREWRDEVLDALAHVEATVDFPDEDLHPEGNAVIAERFERVAKGTSALAATFARGRLYREGARVVLAGRPNVGKSSLLNALAGRSRAIVTAEPGTTRDVVEESIDLAGIPVTLCDTAGIREVDIAAGGSEAEREGVRRSREAAAEADLVLLVFDANAGFGEDDRQAALAVAGRPTLIVANKSDLDPATPRDTGPALAALPSSLAHPVSATTGAGLDGLTSLVRERLAGPGAGDSGGLVVTRARHRERLQAAEKHLRAAGAAARSGVSPDLIASDARRGLDALGEIVGAVSTEDLLGKIFERFCVGK